LSVEDLAWIILLGHFAVHSTAAERVCRPQNSRRTIHTIPVFGHHFCGPFCESHICSAVNSTTIDLCSEGPFSYFYNPGLFWFIAFGLKNKSRCWMEMFCKIRKLCSLFRDSRTVLRAAQSSWSWVENCWIFKVILRSILWSHIYFLIHIFRRRYGTKYFVGLFCCPFCGHISGLRTADLSRPS